VSDREPEGPDLEAINLEDATRSPPRPHGRRRSRGRPLFTTLAVATLCTGAGVLATLALTHGRWGSQRASEAARPQRTAPTTVPGFDDGTWLVKTQIEPGLYENDRGAGCYWARFKDEGNLVSDPIQDDNAAGHAIVAILPTDGAFQSTNCGRWSIYTAESKRRTEFDDGTWAVNTDIEPGQYYSSSGETCFWQRRSNFEATREGLIADKQFSTGSGRVQISPSDVAFLSSSCGHWTKIG
jgi:hypothetical protein